MIADCGLRIADRKKQSARVADAVLSAEDFRERTFQFGIRVIRLTESLLKTDAARADFVAKMGIVEEKCDETLYGLEMLVELQLINADHSKELRAEGNEILAIVVASIRTARGNAKGAVRYTDRV